MHFDDRLATVLRHRASGQSAAQTQFRQLLDLLGNRARGGDQSLLAAAWLRLGALGEQIPPASRADMIAERAWRFRNPELAAHLAEDEPPVAAAALARAALAEDEWAALIPRLPIRARGFLRLRKDLPAGATAVLDRLGVRDRGLPEPEDHRGARLAAAATQDELAREVTAPVPSPRPERAPNKEPATAAGEDTQIGALVRRIEQFRQRRSIPTRSDTGPSAGFADNNPRLPLNEPASGTDVPRMTGFTFTTDAAGRIDWSEPATAPMMVGMRLGPHPADRWRRKGGTLSNALFGQQPIRGEAVTLSGSPMIAGDWILDAAPRFADDGGRFLGYAGKFRKAHQLAAANGNGPPSDADRVRQVLHELRTPVNAIQGFAEVIQQQLFGHTPHEYRALAASIAGDSARMLAGFDELDRLAKLESGALELDEGTSDIAGIVQRQSSQLEPLLAPRMAGMDWTDIAEGSVMVPLAQAETEALTWRILATLAGTMGAGEHLKCSLTVSGGMAHLRCDLPKLLTAEGDVFEATIRANGSGLSAGFFGAGFAVRLVRAEARAVGGDLEHGDAGLILTLPNLTGTQALDSQQTG